MKATRSSWPTAPRPSPRASPGDARGYRCSGQRHHLAAAASPSSELLLHPFYFHFLKFVLCCRNEDVCWWMRIFGAELIDCWINEKENGEEGKKCTVWGSVPFVYRIQCPVGALVSFEPCFISHLLPVLCKDKTMAVSLMLKLCYDMMMHKMQGLIDNWL